MRHSHQFPIPTVDPISGGPLVITELTALESGISIRGQFEVPRYSKLSPEQASFLEIFLRCRGILSSVEKELGVSYPTVRTKLDQLLQSLDLSPIREAGRAVKNGKNHLDQQNILDSLERGEITPEDAKLKIRELAQQESLS